MVKPIVVQAVAAIISVLVVLFVTQSFDWGLFMLFLVKGLLFLVIYLGLNWVLKIDAYGYFMDEFRPVFRKIRGRV